MLLTRINFDIANMFEVNLRGNFKGIGLTFRVCLRFNRASKTLAMKIRILFLLLCTFFTCQTLWAAGFEGSYTVEVHPAKTHKNAQMMRMKVSVKGDKMVSQPLSGMPDKMQEMRVIIDQSDKSIISLMDLNGSKMGMKSTFNEKDLKETEDVQFKKTGKTKTIHGYNCEEYVSETDKQRIIVWISPEMTKKFSGTMSLFAGQGMGGMGSREGNFFNYSAGFPLESSITEIKSGEVTNVYVKDIKEGSVDESLFNTAGYQMIERPISK
jgi:hypothetical protein